MKLFVIGSGGREHAIIWKLKTQNPACEIYCAPGNGGIAALATCVDIAADDVDGLLRFAKDNAVDFTIVGMETPLILGVVDVFRANGLAIFGPDKSAARIEGSKAFSKWFMKKHGIRTADYETFNSYDAALEYCKGRKYPLVVKADGLAVGKGVYICEDFDSANDALTQIMVKKEFGDSGNNVVIEQFLMGTETSVLAFCDGKTIVPMVSAKDHKRAKDGDEGLNTGGMGAISPCREYTPQVERECQEAIFQKTVDALVKEGIDYRGVIFFGLMLTQEGPYVIEYNCRFGDPETQVVLPRLKTSLLDIMTACADGKLDSIKIEWDDNAAACVMLASGGYPQAYEKGFQISGVENASAIQNVIIFHSGTLYNKHDGAFLTNGGRVIGVAALGQDLDAAIDKCYEAVPLIGFKNKSFRTDIGRVK